MSYLSDEGRDLYERRNELAEGIVELLKEMPTRQVALLGESLVLAGGRLAGFGQGLVYFATAVDSEWLAELKIGGELTMLTLPLDEVLLERLGRAEEPLWRALREALLEIAASRDAV